MQKSPLSFVACLLALSGIAVQAQSIWKWRDASGQLHISDTAPPAGTPAKNILSSPPAGAIAAPPSAPAAAPASAPAASAAMSALEKRKAAADQEKADKEKADKSALEAKNEAIRKDNCARARSALADLQSGQRIARVNAKGEREILDDNGRAGETRHAQDAISANCGPAPAAR